ncbi:Helix-turn-helix domain, partial [Dysosmobacter welbionis]
QGVPVVQHLRRKGLQRQQGLWFHSLHLGLRMPGLPCVQKRSRQHQGAGFLPSLADAAVDKQQFHANHSFS